MTCRVSRFRLSQGREAANTQNPLRGAGHCAPKSPQPAQPRIPLQFPASRTKQTAQELRATRAGSWQWHMHLLSFSVCPSQPAWKHHLVLEGPAISCTTFKWRNAANERLSTSGDAETEAKSPLKPVAPNTQLSRAVFQHSLLLWLLTSNVLAASLRF